MIFCGYLADLNSNWTYNVSNVLTLVDDIGNGVVSC